MFELTINNKPCPLSFGLGFLRETENTVTKEIDGVKGKVQKLGLQYAVAGLIDGDISELVDIILRANKCADNGRITKADIEAHIEDERNDIEELFKTVLDFFGKSNCTKKATAAMLEQIEKEKAKQAATQN